MLVSYNWLQTYFKEKLPNAEKLADIITMGVFEIESIEKKGEGENADTVLDVKTLADRNPYCLSHRYIATEIAALLNTEIIIPDIEDIDVNETKRALDISIDQIATEQLLCKRYVGRVIEHVTVTDSPAWLKGQLEILGQRSINSIVDLTNYVMLETGQPLHAFDADLVSGNIQVRIAQEGERIVLLDGTDLALNPAILVIADDIGPLALAGIKGGKRAEVTKVTKNIILEAATFDAALVRKTAQKIGIRNESTKRFENSITTERAGLSIAMLTSHISKLNADCTIGQVKDVCITEDIERSLVVSVTKICDRLGTSLSKKEITDILMRCRLTVSDHTEDSDLLVLSIPPYRRDLEITEDIVDEVGRIYGYTNVEGVEPEAMDRKINKNFDAHNQIRKALGDEGFSEVFTYTLTDNGEVALQNPLTAERAYMRDTISDMMSRKLLFNLRNADLLGLKEIKIFEIGKVFSGTKERYSLAIGIARSKNPKNHDFQAEIKKGFDTVIQALEGDVNLVANIKFSSVAGDAQTQCDGLVGEIDLDPIVNALPEPTFDIDLGKPADIRFKSISIYPFSARDVAVFVPGEAGAEQSVLNSIQNALTEEQQQLLVRTTLFDVFTKRKEDEPVKTSYAYRLVFQSNERTLNEEEIVSMMKSITDALTAQGWEVR